MIKGFPKNEMKINQEDFLVTRAQKRARNIVDILIRGMQGVRVFTCSGTRLE